MVDTQFFPPEFKSRLLSFIPDFDAQCDGLLIHSENFHALNLLQERYREQVKCIYIDPPYNTGNDGFIYRDNYQHSSWLSMMEDRLSVSKDLMNDEAAIFTSMDDSEIDNLKKICDMVFGIDNFVAFFTWKRRSGANDAKNNVSLDHEYVVYYTRTELAGLNGVIKTFENYSNPDNDPRGAWARDNLTCGKTALQRPNLNYPITDPNTGITYNANPNHVWRFEKAKMEEFIKADKIIFPANGKGIPAYKRHKSEVRSDTKPFSSIINTSLNAAATKELRDLLGAQIFDYSKTQDLISQLINQVTQTNINDITIDYFAGSGTTAHAVINLNREDGGNRKYILVEMGDHFNTVLKPRIEKVVYSPDWKDGKPTSFDKGVSHCFKYMRLESYEDTLNNLELPESDPIASSMPPSLREDYMLHYLLDTEANASLLDIDMFKNPFGGYRLKIKRPGSEACDKTPVDLIETFNYLIGLRVSQYYLPRRYSVRFKRAVDPELPGEEGSRRLVLDGRPKLDDAGKWSFLRLEGVVPAHPLNPNNGQTKRVLVIWRNLTGDMEQDNAVLDWFADDLRLNDKVPEYDIVYVNGCNNLGADRKETDSYQVRLIEEEFFRKMWG